MRSGAPDAGAVEEHEDVRLGRQVLYHPVDGGGVRQAAKAFDEDGAGSLGAGLGNDEGAVVVALPEVDAGSERHVQKPRQGPAGRTRTAQRLGRTPPRPDRTRPRPGASSCSPHLKAAYRK